MRLRNRMVVFFVLAVAFAVAGTLNYPTRSWTTIAVGPVMFSLSSVGLAIAYLIRSTRCGPEYLRPHLDRASIEARIRELERERRDA